MKGTEMDIDDGPKQLDAMLEDNKDVSDLTPSKEVNTKGCCFSMLVPNDYI